MKLTLLHAFALTICYKELFAVDTNPETYCYSKDNARIQVKHFASKTAYQVVKGTTFDKDIDVPHCKPVKFWLLSRHGTRLPEKDQIKDFPKLEKIRGDILKNYQKPVMGGLCDEDLELIRNWTIDKNITKNKEQYLVQQGWDDLKTLAMDFKAALPDLLSVYNESNFVFRHTNKQRTRESYRAFVEGLFGPNSDQRIKAAAANKKDTLLKPYDHCDEWEDHKDKKKNDETEAEKFKKSNYMTETIEKVSQRLGFPETLKFKKVKQMLDMCRFESAWNIGKPNAWCAAFTMEDILVFEYLEDLKKEYSNGYSYDLNPNIPCELMQDLLTKLQAPSGPNVTAYFSHSSIIQLFATSLGIQKDSTILTSAGYPNANNRKWRSSELVPFAANYAVVKYDCPDDPVDKSPRVKFFLNQHPIDFEACPDGLCKLSEFVDKFQKYSNVDCKNVFCNLNKKL